VNADGQVVEAAGLRIAGLGGSIRYNEGPNQWTERQQARRAARLVRAAHRHPVDVLLTHSPPRAVGDREDPPHRGFECLHMVVDQLRPKVMVHGHIHPHGQPVPDRELGETRVLNTVGYRILDIP
jgi:Icc-related predicted phosphoesterase